MAISTCIFDLNGTLLDLSVLDPHFGRAFGDSGARRIWFGQLVQLMLTDTTLGLYTPFSELAEAALDMVAAQQGISLTAGNKKNILLEMQRPPAYPDVPEALHRLQQAGIRLAALTQSSLKTAQAQIEHAKLSPYFEKVFSADTAGQLKPGAKPYEMAVANMGVMPAEACLIAAHSWDIAGALSAGLQAAFVARPDQALSPAGLQPDIVGQDLREVAGKIAGLSTAS